MNPQMLLEIWEYFKSDIKPGHRVDHVLGLIRILEEYDLDPDELKTVMGEDDDLDTAINLLYVQQEHEEM